MKPRSRGFTLLEVLVAFVVLAMTMGACLQIFGTGLRGAASAREYAEASFIARSILEEVGRAGPVAFGVESGRDRDYTWELEVSAYAEKAENVPDPDALLFVVPAQIRVTVRWGEGDHRRIELVTLRLVPPANDL